ncbi:MAG: hypothetical protein LAT82_02855 [Nanoarchaeota archaeon]|nr:hypothetical protein [Nanoarchaeota archaeon]
MKIYNINFNQVEILNTPQELIQDLHLQNTYSFQEHSNTLKSLKEAEIYVLMRTRGKLLKSYTSKNILNQRIYYIITQEGSVILTYLIDSNGELLLIEETPSHNY